MIRCAGAAGGTQSEDSGRLGVCWRCAVYDVRCAPSLPDRRGDAVNRAGLGAEVHAQGLTA